MTVLEWDVAAVASWMSRIGLGTYAASFADNNITGDVLVYLGHGDLQDIGIRSVGHRLRVLKAIYELIVSSDLKLDAGYYIPPTVLEAMPSSTSSVPLTHPPTPAGPFAGSVSVPGLEPTSATSAASPLRSTMMSGEEKAEATSPESSWDTIVHSFEVRDERISYAETEIKKLMEGYMRLREDLLPIFRIVKESKPLPTPDATSPGPSGNSTQLQPSPTLATSYANSPTTASSPPPSYAGPQSLTPQVSSPSVFGKKQVASKSNANGGITSKSLAVPSEWYDDQAPQLAGSGSALTGPARPTNKLTRKSSMNGHSGSNPPTASSTPVTAATPQTSSTGPTSASSTSLMYSSVAAGGSTSAPSVTEPFKSFRVSMDDPCHKVLPVALRKYKISADPRQYALLVCYGDQERLLGLEEKPLMIFKELQDAGKRPVFMLRHIEGPNRSNAGVVVSATPGGVL